MIQCNDDHDDGDGNDPAKNHDNDDDEETFEYGDGDEHVIWQNMWSKQQCTGGVSKSYMTWW